MNSQGEFIASLRDLKQRSGLTYRQLEKRAAERGKVLARSTLADVLAGKRMPAPDVLDAFVHACGEGDQAESWQQARASIAEPAPVPTARRRRSMWWLIAAGLVVLVSVGTWFAVSGDRPESPAAVPTSPVRIRPVAAPDLCLTDGHVRDGRYGPLVAVQRPCSAVAPQTTTLEPLGADLYRIAWHHPQFGKGCLKVLADGLLEPWDDCTKATPFTFERAEDKYTLRVEGRGCVGIAGTGESAEALVGECDQRFVIDAA